MFISPKRYIRVASGEIVEAEPGLSGTLVVAKDAELPEQEAIELGILDKITRPEITQPNPISRNPTADAAAAKANDISNAPTKPWEADPTAGLPKVINFSYTSKPADTEPKPPALPINE